MTLRGGSTRRTEREEELWSRPRYRPSEAARWLGIPDSTVRRWLAAGIGTDDLSAAPPLIPSEPTDWCRRAQSLVAAHNLRLMLTESRSTLGEPSATRCDTTHASCRARTHSGGPTTQTPAMRASRSGPPSDRV